MTGRRLAKMTDGQVIDLAWAMGLGPVGADVKDELEVRLGDRDHGPMCPYRVGGECLCVRADLLMAISHLEGDE